MFLLKEELKKKYKLIFDKYSSQNIIVHCGGRCYCLSYFTGFETPNLMLVHVANGQEKSYNKIIGLVDDSTTRNTTVLERNFKINSLYSGDWSKKQKTFRSSPLSSKYCGAGGS